mgnify:CR=1 FL=1
MVRVLIALVDGVVARGFRAMLDEAEDCTCAAVVQEIEDIREAVEEQTPAVVLMDVAFRRADAELLPDLLALDP